jgi:K+-sensing histidine kinase KdpD
MKRLLPASWLSWIVSILCIGAALVLEPTSPAGAIVLTVGLVMFTSWTFIVREGLRERKRLLDMQAVAAVNQAIRAQIDYDAVLQTISVQVSALLETDQLTIALYDPDTGYVSYPLKVRAFQPIHIQPHKLGIGAVDKVLLTKQPLLFERDAAARAREMGIDLDMPTTSWLGVPFTLANNGIGCIAVGLSDAKRRLTENHQRILSTIAAQSSTAMENASLYPQNRQHAKHLARLNDIAGELASLSDIQTLYETITQSVLTITPAMASALYFWHENDSNVLFLARATGLPESYALNPVMPLAMKDRAQTIVVSNAQTERRAALLAERMDSIGVGSWIEVPLRSRGEMLGFLVVYYNAPHKFTENEVELLQAFGNQAALSIGNARLYWRMDEALDRHSAQLTALTAINRELSSVFNVDRVLNLVLQHAMDGTRSSAGVLLLNIETEQISTTAERGTKMSISRLHRSIDRVMETGQPYVERMPAEEGIRARMAVPIVRDYENLGVIVLESQTHYAYTQDDVSFVRQLTVQMAIAVENVRMLEWMQEGRNRLQVILDSMHEGVLMFSMDGRVSLANPSVEMLLGLQTSYIVNERVAQLCDRPELAFATRLGFEADELIGLIGGLSGGAIPTMERHSFRLDVPQPRFIDRTLVPVHDQYDKVIGLLLVFTDATEQRQLEQAREDLSRMIVHDLRGPLTAISTSLKLLTELVPEGATFERPVKRTVDVSQRALRKLLGLVNSLLDIAKMESGDMTIDPDWHNLRSIADNVRIELSPLSEELDIAIEVDISDDVPMITMDSDKIERVLLNLVDNALKFTPSGGSIIIRAMFNSGNVRVDVVDSGPGVPDAFKKKIFDRFQQVEGSKGHRRGTGLGLTFCRLTVEAHGGRIWIEDNPAGGSIFAFTLPVTQMQSEEV